MLAERNIKSFAKIPVEQVFCCDCSARIKKVLQEINGIANVRLYPLESLICFNFVTANTLSTALNVLSDIGLTEKGDRTFVERFSMFRCGCQKNLRWIKATD